MTAVTDRILAYNKGRVEKYLALKYQAMSENAFRFFRGSCHLFYEDLSHHNTLPPSPLAWVCGDLHIENFGSYKGDNRLVYFDLNDFDEAILAPACWEIARFVTSVVVAFDSLGVSREIAETAIRDFLKIYSSTLTKEKARYIDPLLARGIVRIFLEKVAMRRQKDIIAERALRKGTSFVLNIDKIRCFKISKELKQDLVLHLENWMHETNDERFQFKVLDAGFRIAGTGSIGMKRYVFLLNKTDNPAKYILLDMKQAGPSSLLPYAGITQPAWPSEAARVTGVQYRTQNVSPALLSTMNYKNDPYVIREMQPTEDKIDFNLVRNRAADISQVIHDMAVLTASAHLRSAGRQGSALPDSLIEFGHNPNWQESLVQYALSYAEQVKKDFGDFKSDHEKGLPGSKPEQPVAMEK